MADYSDVYPWIRQTLRDAASELNNVDFDLTISSVLRSILSPRGLTYATVPPDDLEALNEAAGLLTSVRLWPGLTTGGLGGYLTSAKDDDASESYGGQDELLAAWRQQAMQALRSTSFGGAFSAPGTSAGGVNGPSRARRAACDGVRGPWYYRP